MYEFKSFILNYNLWLNIGVVLLSIGILCFIIFDKNRKFIVPKVFTLIFLLLSNFMIKPIILSTYPLYGKRDCFKFKKIINKNPIESWHKPFLEKEIEFHVLKVGKENYYTTSTEPKLEDFPFKLDGLTEKSDCSNLFGKK